MHAIDTNVLVRLLTRDDKKQVEKAESFITRGAWISSLVLAETVWILQSVYDLSAKQISLAVNMLLQHAELVLQDADMIEKALLKYQNNPKVGFTDYLILETAIKAGHTPLGSFDKAFGKVAAVIKLEF